MLRRFHLYNNHIDTKNDRETSYWAFRAFVCRLKGGQVLDIDQQLERKIAANLLRS